MIRRLRLRNFRRYEDETFEFPEGATFIEGENNAGKTSILYAIEYALFGNVAQFKSPAALLRPKTKAGGVELDFEGLDGKNYRLQRIHAKPPRARSKVTGHYTLIELRDETTPDVATDNDTASSPTEPHQEVPGVEPSGRYLLSSDFQDHEEKLALKIVELLGISKRVFELAISTRQSETARILAGSPKLDIVLGITAVALAEEEFRSMALQREKQCNSLPLIEESLKRAEEELTKFQVREESLAKEAQELKTQRERLLEQQQAVVTASGKMQQLEEAVAKLDELTDEAQLTVYNQQSLNEQLQQLKTDHGDVDTLKAKSEETNQLFKAAETKLQKADGVVNQLRADLRKLDLQIGDLAGRIQRRSRLDSDATTCETCGQAIDPERAQQELMDWRSEHARLTSDQEQLQRQIEGAEATTTECRDKVQQTRDQGGETQRLLDELGNMQSRLTALDAQAAKSAPAIESAYTKVLNISGDFQKISEPLEVELAIEAVDSQSPSPIAARMDSWRGAITKAGTALEVKAAQCKSELESNAAMRERHDSDYSELQETKNSLARESAQLQTELESLRAAQEQAATLRLCSKAFQELQQRLREQAAESLATNTLDLHRELSHSDEYTKLTIDPSNYAVQVKAKDYDQFAPAAVFQGGGHRVLLGLAFKLAVARIVGHCPFLLLDEPTDGLDQQHRQQLIERLGSIDVTRQMLVITHQGTDNETGHRIRIKRNKKTSKQVS